MDSFLINQLAVIHCEENLRASRKQVDGYTMEEHGLKMGLRWLLRWLGGLDKAQREPCCVPAYRRDAEAA